MIKELIRLANHLDSLGLTKEADELDEIVDDTDFRSVVYVKIHGARLSDDATLLYYGEIHRGINEPYNDDARMVERFKGLTIEEVKELLVEMLKFADSVPEEEQKAYKFVDTFIYKGKPYYVDFNSDDNAKFHLSAIANDDILHGA